MPKCFIAGYLYLDGIFVYKSRIKQLALAWTELL